MSNLSYLRLYLVCVVTFFAMDLVWLGLVATDFYSQQLGALLRPDVVWPAALAFYFLFVAGIVFFVVLPSLERSSRRYAALAGGFFGLVTYATFDLTSLALIDGFPMAVVAVDLVWGMVLTATVASAGYAFQVRQPDRDRHAL